MSNAVVTFPLFYFVLGAVNSEASALVPSRLFNFVFVLAACVDGEWNIAEISL